MRNVLALFENNLKLTILKKKKFFILLVVAPIAFLILYSTVMGKSSQTTINIGVVNKDNSLSSRAIIASLDDNTMINIKNINESSVQSNINSKDIDFAIIIPKDFQDNILNDKDAEITIETIEGNDLYKSIDSVINSEINNLRYIANASMQNTEAFEEGVHNYLEKSINLKTNNLTNIEGDYEVTLSFIGILIFFMFTISSFATKSISEDRKNNVYARVFMAPINPWQYYLANIMTCIISLSLQIALALLALKYIVKIELGVRTIDISIILFSIGLLAIVLELLVMNITKDDTSMLGSIIILIMSMLGGCFVPMSLFPSYINKISMLMPTRWAMQAITDLQQGFTFFDVSKYIIYTLVLTLILLIIVAYMTSKEEKVFKEL
ncbi:MAG: ABC transporter permease [Clostridium perfringens]|nr:ABC transporter permease [Clostridium perfringens]